MAFFESTFGSVDPKRKAELGTTLEVFHELERSPDRVVAIVGCAMLDDQMKSALLRRFVKSDSAHKKFFNDGPGHETSDKIYLCYTLGVFGDEARTCLSAIASIRNKFAHRLHVRSFGHGDLKTALQDVTLYKRLKEPDALLNILSFEPVPDNAGPRKRFIASVTYAHAMLILDAFRSQATSAEGAVEIAEIRRPKF